MLKWLKRNVDSRPLEDQAIIDNIEYNSMSGAQKNIEVGPALEYIGNLTSAVGLPKGSQLYIFNTGALAYVKMGDVTVTAPGAAPAVDTFPCLPNDFTRYSLADYTHVIGSAALHLYVVRDESNARRNISDR